MPTYDPYGCYRVIDPPGTLPQNCWKIDNEPVARGREILVNVELINVDSSSFRQLAEQSKKEDRPIEDLILQIIDLRGKLHNPLTGSGGMLIGTTSGGERIASLVSLSLTPLKLDHIDRVDWDSERLLVEGKAILFEKSLHCRVPTDLPETVSLAVLDVAGAPAACAELCRKARRILIMGAGKAGLLVAAAARRENREARIYAIDSFPENLGRLQSLQLCDWNAAIDARQPLQVYEAVREATDGALCDLTFNLVNQPNTEGASILATRDGGTIYFFSMATSFAKAALTAEGLARDVQMMIGSGFRPGWTDYALGLVRESAGLRAYLEKRYGP